MMGGPFAPSMVQLKSYDKPLTTPWNGTQIERRHSFRAAVLDLMRLSINKGFATVSVLGPQASGKSTFVRSLAHLFHVGMASKGVNYEYREWDENALLNIDAALNTIKTNTIIHLDDISFARDKVSNRKYAEVKSVLSKIRHRPWGDVRVVLIFSYHHNTALDPFTRSTDMTAIPEITKIMIKNMASELTDGNARPLWAYQRMVAAAQLDMRWGRTIKTPEGRRHMYRYRVPFSPCLWHDKRSARIILFPHRQWLAPDGCGICGFHALKPCCRKNNNTAYLESGGCDTCHHTPNMDTMQQGDSLPMADVATIWADIAAKHPTHTKQATRLWLASRGRFVGGKHTLAAVRRIEEAVAGHAISYDQVEAMLANGAAKHG